MRTGFRCGLAAGLMVAMATGATAFDAGTAPKWPDTVLSRIAALALLQSLNADLLSHDSATLTLDRWCTAHHLAREGKIVAERDRNAAAEPTAEQRRLLDVTSDEPVRYRRVRLLCGPLELSHAENWYVPSRLTRDMNEQLDTSDVAFGRLLQPLHFKRHTLSADLLWQPLPSGWETGIPLPTMQGDLAIPADLLRHIAILTLPDGRPISEVVETYTNNVLAFPPPFAK